ncbi:dihydrofolate reductase family protein [Flagellimonas pacifica]|uniref:Dihydrofolate reductase n=1 Tax=Flagellimonas pacifica TaxID=1247520 RepID=A0A285MCF4_9FLAO|nr:dihydrofolate reductase family protein [Allomuricauda parva]SNY94768.1 Dihydrofolate reductase [Allomuricauda parva]
MQKIVYYVACSLDGFISGPNEDISQFLHEGNGVEKYKQDLLDFKTVIMGRKTYEFGYQFGLVPGKPAYPHMEHFIFSNSMEIENLDSSVHIVDWSIEEIEKIKRNAQTDIYLCGGGVFAGWLLENNLIDTLKIKLNPIVLGNGTRLFGQSNTSAQWHLENQESYDGGLQILTYNLKN